MNLPEVFKNKKNLAAMGAVTLIVAGSIGGGLYFAEKKEKEMAQKENEQTQTPKSDNDDNLKTNDPKTETETKPQESEDQTQTLVTDLSDISLQATLDENNQILVSLYGNAGTYKVQKNVNNTWSTIVEAGNYGGRGGFILEDTFGSSETTRLYRVYRIVNGTSSQAKEIFVNRATLLEKGGVYNFSEGQ